MSPWNDPAPTGFAAADLGAPNPNFCLARQGRTEPSEEHEAKWD